MTMNKASLPYKIGWNRGLLLGNKDDLDSSTLSEQENRAPLFESLFNQEEQEEFKQGLNDAKAYLVEHPEKTSCIEYSAEKKSPAISLHNNDEYDDLLAFIAAHLHRHS